MRILCKIDIHKWPKVDYINYKETRTCKKCGVKQHWCAGNGGSEIGCWGLGESNNCT